MQMKTAAVIVAVPKHELFSYVANIENVPKWATEFCRELKTVNGETKVVTEGGELFFRIQADEETGVIDFLAGRSAEQLATFPTRVVGLPTGTSAYLFTLFRAPEMSDEEFEQAYRSLLIELETLKQNLS